MARRCSRARRRLDDVQTQGADGRRIVVQLHDATDPEHGGSYTLKRWRVAKTDKRGGVTAVDLRPDNPSFQTMHTRPESGDIRPIAEFLEVLG